MTKITNNKNCIIINGTKNSIGIDKECEACHNLVNRRWIVVDEDGEDHLMCGECISFTDLWDDVEGEEGE